jgi:hypothetical protein
MVLHFSHFFRASRPYSPLSSDLPRLFLIVLPHIPLNFTFPHVSPVAHTRFASNHLDFSPCLGDPATGPNARVRGEVTWCDRPFFFFSFHIVSFNPFLSEYFNLSLPSRIHSLPFLSPPLLLLMFSKY